MKPNTLDSLIKEESNHKNRDLISFEEYLETEIKNNPRTSLRNIFQYFSDMVKSHVGDGFEEYPNDPELIDFRGYDTSTLLESSAEPFFADRIFANKFVKMVDSMKSGAKQNKVYIFEGPAGSGKTSFVNNLIDKLEEYSHTEEGKFYETVWKIDPNLFRDLKPETIGFQTKTEQKSLSDITLNDKRSIIIPCPNHTHPILHIAKDSRKEFLDNLIEDNEFKEKLFSMKEYEWIFKEEPSSISSSIFDALVEKTTDYKSVFKMLHARPMHFDRKKGTGINIFNAGDRHYGDIHTNEYIQKQLNRIMRDSTLVNYMYSNFANSNNGIYVIMDLKDNNKRRLTDLHGIISDGIKRVGNLEESISSIFIVTKNIEDNVNEAADMRESFRDRVELLSLNRIVDYQTEIKIYKKTFGDLIEDKFLPGVLDVFAKAIVSTRLENYSDSITNWIEDSGEYIHRCDEGMKIMKMELYSGNKPRWLTKTDTKSFSSNAYIKKSIIDESSEEGIKGYSVRKSINELSRFLSKHNAKASITIEDVHEYLAEKVLFDDDAEDFSENFLDALVSDYYYDVLDDMKDSIFSYNEKDMYNDVMDYLVAITSEKDGQIIVSPFTGRKLKITEEYLANKEAKILGTDLTKEERIESMYRYRKMLARDIAKLNLESKKISDHIRETEFYNEIIEDYKSNVRKHILDEFFHNDTFMSAIRNYETDKFKIYDDKTRNNVSRLLWNMQDKYGYTLEGAKDVSIEILSNSEMMYSALFSE